MSYDIVKNISIKNRSITSACNNLRPISYETIHLTTKTEEDFIKYVLVNSLWGNYHLQNSKNLVKFRYTIYLYNQLDDELKNDIYNKIWRNYDYKTKTYRYSEEEVVQATKKLGSILYDLYKSVEITKGNYIIKFGSDYYVKKLGSTTLSYTWYQCRAKVYSSLEEAKIVEDEINKNYETRASVIAI